MTRSLARGLLVSIPVWLAGSLILALAGDVRVSTTTFFAGGSVVVAVGVLFLSRNRPPRMTPRPSVLYSALLLYSISAALFVYSGVVVRASMAFYLALALLIVGSGGILIAVRRSSNVS